MKPTGKYAYSLDGEYYFFSFATKDEAFKEANAEAIYRNQTEGDEIQEVYVGQRMAFVPKINVESIIEQLQDQADEEAGEFADGFLDGLKPEQKRLLECRLNLAIERWLFLVNQDSYFFTVEDVEARPVSYDEVIL